MNRKSLKGIPKMTSVQSIDPEELKKTFLALAVIPNPSKEEREISGYIRERLAPFAASIREDGAGGRIGGNCGNLFVEIEGTAAGAPRILLNAHMDSVNPCRGVKPIVEGDTIRSDGTTVLCADDNAGIAIIIEVVRYLKEKGVPHGPLQLLFTVSEETGLEGVKNMDAGLLKADFGYALDGGAPAGVIVNRSPYQEKITAVFRGLAAHAGVEPEKGIHAIKAAAAAIVDMPIGRIDAETTANIGVISGGRATNIIPDETRVEGEARSHDLAKLAAQVDAMKSHLRKGAESAGAKVEIEVRREFDSFHLSPDSAVVVRYLEAARRRGIEPAVHTTNGGFDANIINAAGVATATICDGASGPHSLEETLSISDAAAGADILLELIAHAAKEG